MVNCSEATWGDEELENQIHLKCKCCLCVSLVIACYRGVKECDSAGHTHLNGVAREGERVGLSAVTEQRLEEKKGFAPPAPVPTSPSSISLLETTPKAHLYRGQYTGGVHPWACSHTSVLLCHVLFLPVIAEILCISTACIKCYVEVFLNIFF